jgi:hypothetical protein
MTEAYNTNKNKFVRSFNTIELEQIKELKIFMATAFDSNSWNFLRDEAKSIWSEKIISAVDGLRKWRISYDKASKSWISHPGNVKFGVF